MIEPTKTKPMKKYIISLLLACSTLAISAQPAGMERLYYTYKGEEGVVAFRVPGFLMKFAGMCAGLDHSERQLLRSLRSVRILTIEDQDLYSGVNFAEEVDAARMRDGYQLLMEVHEPDEDVIISARERNGKITDLIVIVGGSENTLVHVKGRMNCDLLESLSEVAGLKELRYTAEL